MKKGFKIICFIIIGLYIAIYAYALIEVFVDFFKDIVNEQMTNSGYLINIAMEIPFMIVLATPLIMFYKYTKNKRDSLLKATTGAILIIVLLLGCSLWLGGLD